MLDVPAITSAIARGDRAAFARLYEAKFGLVFATAKRAIGSDENACLDVVQEAFMRAIRKMKRLDTEAALDGWLVTTTKRAAYDALRGERRRRGREAAVALDARATIDPDTTRAEDAERLAWLRAQLAGLDRVASDAVHLRLRAGMSLAQAGRALGLKPGAVDGRVTRAVESMRAGAREKFDG